MPTTDGLPDYEPMLAAYHRAFAAELRAMIAGLPLSDGDRVVEVACGDGAYTPMLAERVGASGTVLAVDVSAGYLKLARAGAMRSSAAARVGLVAARIERPPLPEGAFDLAWCAQSLYSLPDPVDALRRMERAARPGGVVAVFENDEFHHVLLPWPVEVELAVREAEMHALAERSGSSETYYVGRRLVELFRGAGLGEVRAKSFAATRQAPLGAPERDFLVAYLAGLRDRVAGRLDAATKDRFLALVDPVGDDGLVNRADLTLTVLDHVVTGVRPR